MRFFLIFKDQKLYFISFIYKGKEKSAVHFWSGIQILTGGYGIFGHGYI
jgi:hypothetical protein